LFATNWGARNPPFSPPPLGPPLFFFVPKKFKTGNFPEIFSTPRRVPPTRPRPQNRKSQPFPQKNVLLRLFAGGLFLGRASPGKPLPPGPDRNRFKANETATKRKKIAAKSTQICVNLPSPSDPKAMKKGSLRCQSPLDLGCPLLLVKYENGVELHVTAKSLAWAGGRALAQEGNRAENRLNDAAIECRNFSPPRGRGVFYRLPSPPVLLSARRSRRSLDSAASQKARRWPHRAIFPLRLMILHRWCWVGQCYPEPPADRSTAVSPF